MLKLRSKQRMFSGLSRSFGTLQTGVRATSFLGSCVLGPQVSLAFSMAGLSHTQHTHGGPEPAHLQVEVCFAFQHAVSSPYACISWALGMAGLFHTQHMQLGSEFTHQQVESTLSAWMMVPLAHLSACWARHTSGRVPVSPQT